MIILGTNSIKDTGFDVANSCRFNSASSDSMTRDNGTPTDLKKFSISLWHKRAEMPDNKYLITGFDDEDNRTLLQFSSDQLLFQNQTGGSNNTIIKSNAKFRDPSAWYHFCIIVDTTQGTDTNRVKMYVNGSQVTSLASSTYPSVNTDMELTDSANSILLNQKGDGSDFNSGYYSEVVVLDGTAASITDFGEFDEDSGIWKPISVSGLTFGNNGFYLDFENSGALGADVSGNTNNFTVNNLTATDQSTDTCTNNFATLNPLRTQAGYTKVMSEGNCVWEHGQAGQNASIPSTIAASSGKWYAEFLCSTSANNWGFGIAQVNVTNNGSMAGYPDSQGGVTYVKNGNLSWYAGGDQSSDTGTTFAADDIIAILMDLDNTRVYWYKNDTLVNSGGFDYSVVNSGSTIENNYYFMVGATDDGTNPIIKANFGGSPGFAISSGNTDGNGYGNFEFATKGGYALNTKNLAEYG
ncbi:hypothetical protein N9Y58_01355 [Alphaproteobacteria bacterium]|nr:hypothetical protein [Alphaproteobacteria bacterium]